MEIKRIKISKILGIDELEFRAGKFNQISGKNGQGKTSVLEAIKAATQGGTDATLLRKGEEKGEVVLVLDDGTEIQKRLTQRGATLTVTNGDGSKEKRPTDVLKGITDMLSINPVDFLRAPKKDRVRVLLETMPIKVDTARLAEISGVPVTADPDAHGLAVIDLVRKQVYDDRTGTNRAVTEKEATINQIELAMPDAPAGVTGSEDEIRAQLTEATTTRDTELQRITTKLSGLQQESSDKIAKLRADAQAQIDAINAQLAADVEAERASFANIADKAGKQRELTLTRYSEAATPLEQALAVIRENRAAVAKREQAIDTVEKMREELQDLKDDAARQTQALADIDAYKIELLASLPIPGLEVIDGELFRDGVAFDRLNTAQQVDIAVEIAKLRAGELAICCVDGLELLSSEAFESFKQRAIESGLQLFVTRVSDDEFNITAE